MIMAAPMEEKNMSAEESSQLTEAQKARMERNRQKALMLRKSRLTNRPYPDTDGVKSSKAKNKISGRVIDTKAGFLLEEDEEPTTSKKKIHSEPGPILATEYLFCGECNKPFLESYLHSHYNVLVCDSCRDPEEQHKLITKSDAKSIYLLKDADIDRWEPPLKFIIKKNPHNSVWGDMKLYLESQVKARSLEVWGSEEKIEEAKEKRKDNKEKLKQKRFDKKVKDLRNAVRSSLWTKDTSVHEHDYGPESYDEDSDMYSKSCQCGHTLTYEKM